MATESSPIRLASSRFAHAAHVLGKAFVNDPFVRTLYPNDATRQRFFSKTAECILRYASARGEIYIPSPNVEGVAVWFPAAHVEPTLLNILRAGFYRLPFSLGFGSIKRILTYSNYTAALRARYLKGSYWYLQLLGVDPSQRGRGFAGCLLRSMLERFDRDGTICCLDTENEVNVTMYKHFGFRVLECGDIPGSGCRCWLMARDAAAR